MYLDTQLQTYLDDLASAQSTPGGGSTAALSGAMGAALACMVTRLTLGKEAYAAVQPQLEVLLAQAEQLRARFQTLLQADIEAYGKLSASFKLPRTTSEAKAARTRAIQERLLEAALVPLEMVERAAELAQCCLQVAQIGNTNVLSDIATGVTMASSAGTGAAWMVRVNLHSLKDQDQVSALSARLNTALETIDRSRQQVVATVEARA